MSDQHTCAVADNLGESYASLFHELSVAFRARGLPAEEAGDLAQETIVRTFVHLKRHGRTKPDLRPLAHTIARRLYIERGRRLRPRFVGLPEAEQMADPAPEPVELVVASEERRDVHAALKALAPRHRRVVSLWMSGLRPAEIARELGIKRNAADALLHRARRQLAAKLDPSRVTLGLVGVAVLRVRALFRRAVDAVAGLDPSGSVTQATTGLAVVGLTAALMVATPAGGTNGPTGEASDARAAVTKDAGTANGPIGEVSEPSSMAGRPKVPTVRYPYQIARRTVVRDPATKQDRDVGFGSDYTPEGGIGLLDPALEPALREACGLTPRMCTENG